ncbi:ParA family protein, partial [Clostridium perfringens]
MKRIEVIKELERELEDYFINDIEKEWIDLRIVNVTGVDLTVVSEKGENIKECYNKIEDIFLEINSKIDKEDEKLFIRKKRIYSVYEAEIFEVDKPIRVKKKGFTFGELVDNLNFNKDTNIENKKHKSKVVSFYSYKGGVGRTVILIQTAYLLASKGKRVAIIDLDIEAPSFNDIFENDISNNNGMINYLYNKLYNIKSEEDESIVKFVSKLNTNVSGEVYVIPAGKISLKYIKMLELLKEKRIYENEYISEFIEELEKQYNVDYVLIDSRTGLNNWGALSISNISDELFLCAYPNKENVRGINMISELINDNKKYNVIFSRIDNSDEGEKKAKELFDQLKINQDFIGIF